MVRIDGNKYVVEDLTELLAALASIEGALKVDATFKYAPQIADLKGWQARLSALRVSVRIELQLPPPSLVSLSRTVGGVDMEVKCPHSMTNAEYADFVFRLAGRFRVE